MNPIVHKMTFTRAARQRGAVLFVALIFLVLMTMLAVVASNTSIMQERMTGGMRNTQLAQMGADSAVRGMEFRIWSATSRLANLVCDNTGGPDANFPCYQRFVASAASDTLALDDRVRAFRYGKGVLPVSGDGATDAPLDFSASAIPESARLAARPRVMVENLGRFASLGGDPENVHSGEKPPSAASGGGMQDFYGYRITARSTGGTNATVRLAESVFLAQQQPISTAPTPP